MLLIRGTAILRVFRAGSWPAGLSKAKQMLFWYPEVSVSNHALNSAFVVRLCKKRRCGFSTEFQGGQASNWSKCLAPLDPYGKNNRNEIISIELGLTVEKLKPQKGRKEFPVSTCLFANQTNWVFIILKAAESVYKVIIFLLT